MYATTTAYARLWRRAAQLNYENFQTNEVNSMFIHGIKMIVKSETRLAAGARRTCVLCVGALTQTKLHSVDSSTARNYEAYGKREYLRCAHNQIEIRVSAIRNMWRTNVPRCMHVIKMTASWLTIWCVFA